MASVKRTVARRAQRAKAAIPITKIRIGQGEEEGYTNMSVADLSTFADESIEAIYLSNMFHRLTREQRYALMNEGYRILKPGGRLQLICPYWNTRAYAADPLSQWPPLCEESFLVYSQEFRSLCSPEIGALPLTCDFYEKTPQGALIVVAGHEPEPDIAGRNEEYRTHASRYWNNAVKALHVTLTKH